MNDLDRAALSRWLAKRQLNAKADLQLERISGGQSNPTWFVTWGENRFVLRKKPTGKILPGAHAIEREFRILKALENTDIPVPKALWLEEDPCVLGTPFYVMERIEGRVFSDCSLPGIDASARREMYLDMARVLASLHAVRPNAVGLADYGRPSGYFQRQIARWSAQYEGQDHIKIDALDQLVKWLPENMPPDDAAVSIAHGDFHLGNLMFHPTEPRVVAVLDWELSTLGHPLADLGFSTMPWHSNSDEYGGILDIDWAALGIPTREEFVAQYFEHSLHKATLLPFHVAFALFRFAVIFVGIANRVKAGTAASSEAAQLEPLAARFAQRALDAIKQVTIQEI